MAAHASQTAALLTEHLQYTPLSLIDDIINSVNNWVYSGIGSLETGLFAAPPDHLGFKPRKPDAGDGASSTEPDYPEAKQEIEEGLHKLETLLNSTVDKNFDKFEIYVLRNILSVPTDLAPWINLTHYEGISFPPSQGAPTVESVQLLRRKLVASRTVAKALQEEHNRNTAVLKQLQSLRTVPTHDVTSPNLSFLADSSTDRPLHLSTLSEHLPLTTNTNFTLSQLPTLRAILNELRPRLTELKATNLTAENAKDERREERREYIEQRTKAHLERNGHAIPGSSSSAALSGKRTEPDEVGTLDKVAAMFGPS